MFLPSWFLEPELLQSLPGVGDSIMYSAERISLKIFRRFKTDLGIFFECSNGKTYPSTVCEWWPEEGDICMLHSLHYSCWLADKRNCSRHTVLGDRWLFRKVIYVKRKGLYAEIKHKDWSQKIPINFLIVETDQGAKTNANTGRLAA